MTHPPACRPPPNDMNAPVATLLTDNHEDSDSILAAKRDLQDLSIVTLLRFLSLCGALKDDIAQAQHVLQPRDVIPHNISRTIVEFLANAMNVPQDIIDSMWAVFGAMAWEYPLVSGSKIDEDAFAIHGWRRSLGDSVDLSSTYKFLTEA